MMYNTEASLVSDLCDSVPHLWGPDATSRVEVRCHDQASMDVLVQTPVKLIGIEAKLSHWNRVLAQAYLHRYCVDLVFVALPADKITEARLLEAAWFDIGVIAVDNGSTHILQDADPARPVNRIRQRLVDLATDSADTLRSV